MSRWHHSLPVRAASALLGVAVWICGAVLICGAVWPAATQSRDASPSPENLHRLVERLIANTHRSDAALAEYERVERWIERPSAHDFVGIAGEIKPRQSPRGRPKAVGAKPLSKKVNPSA